MASLQNMLNVYFHMKNHYKKLKNVQSRINTNNNNKSHSGSRSKKQRVKPKSSPTGTKDASNKERPPTRRNPNDFSMTDKTRILPLSPNGKFKSTSLGSQTPRNTPLANCEQHEYLQFSLRITEEIIRNDLYKNEEMIRVLKMHYQANKARLDHDKLLKTIGELCVELNIPLDDNMLKYLESSDNSSRGYYDCSGTKSAGAKDNKIPYHIHIFPSGDQLFQNDAMKNNNVGTSTDTSYKKCSDSEDNDDDKEKQGKKHCQNHLAINDKDFCEKNKSEKSPTSKEKEKNYEIEVIQAPTQMDDLSKAFEFGEETLNAPGEDSVSNLHFKDFQVLHDGTAKFYSDKDSDLSLGSKYNPHGSQTAIQQFGSQYTNNLQVIKSSIMPDKHTPVNDKDPNREKFKEIARKLVVSHYTTSVEPSTTETKEFSVQTTSAAHTETQSPPFRHDASTQKSMSLIESDSENRMIAEFQKNTNTSSQELLDMMNKCKCQCGDGNDPNSSRGSNFLTSTEAQFVLLDCPVLIPKEHTASMDILGNRNMHYENIGKSFHTLMRMGHKTPAFQTKEKSPTPRKNSPPPDLHNRDYDLTPQKELFQGGANLVPKPIDRSCCSCIIPGDKNLLLSNRYDRYKKVNEKLSFFYPSIATQVSSMDLMPVSSQIVGPRIERDGIMDRSREWDGDRDRYRDWDGDRDRARNREWEDDRGRNRGDWERDRKNVRINMSGGDRDRNIERERNRSRYLDRDSDRDRNKTREYENYDILQEVKRTPGSPRSFYGPPPTIPRKEKINIDNYRIETKQNEFHQSGQKRHFGEDAFVDRDSDQNQNRSKAYDKEGRRTRSCDRRPSDDEEVPRNDNNVKQNVFVSDSMERRIMNLRQDIEKYNDESSKRNQTSQVNSIPDVPTRSDLLEMLKPNSPLPTEVPLPRHKKMSVLRNGS